MKNNIIYFIIAAILIGVMICVIVFVIPSVEKKGGNSSGGGNGQGTTFADKIDKSQIHVKMPSNDDDFKKLEEKVKAYENGDKTVFNSEADYARAWAYARDYKDIMKSKQSTK